MKLKDVNKRQKHVVASTYLLVLLKAYLRILVYVSQAETGRHVLSRHALKRDFHLQCVQSPKEYWWVHFVIQNYLRYSVYGQTVLTAENSGSPLSSPANPTVLTTNLGRWIRFQAPHASHQLSSFPRQWLGTDRTPKGRRSCDVLVRCSLRRSRWSRLNVERSCAML